MSWWESTLRFLSFQDTNSLTVLIGCTMLGAGSGALGCYAYLNRRSLLGDALAHATLPGLCAAFLAMMLFLRWHDAASPSAAAGWTDGLAEWLRAYGKSPLILGLGGMASSGLAILVLNFLTSATRISQDSALAIVLSVPFGLGTVLLTGIQQTGDASQSGLTSYLFGQAAAMVYHDALALSIIATLIALVLVVGYKHFKIVTFDPDFARALG